MLYMTSYRKWFKFSNQVVGINKLANYIKDMINEAGFKDISLVTLEM